MTGTAIFSADRVYRYTLERSFPRSLFSQGGLAVWIALNPSTASETVNDPTIRREIEFSMRWGYSGLRKLNIYAYRSTDPDALKTAADPVGPDNDRHLLDGTADAKIIVCAWGTKALPGRAEYVVSLLKRAGRTLHCLRRTANGSPEHALYMPGDVTPIPYGDAR